MLRALMSPRPPPPDADLVERREILDEAGMARVLRRMAYEMIERAGGQAHGSIFLIGVRTGGAYLANRLAGLIRAQAADVVVTVGAVDISLYRDDVFLGLPKPEIGPTDLPASVDGGHVILVDDVLFTGRTVRAAMDVLADYGRPHVVRLAVLVDRGRRELPIQPDFVGVTVQTTASESVRVMLKERGEVDRIVLRERRA
jgi:pyrimidine operon attenuation protein/uracil phosphoribosyltransferase